MQTFQSMKDLGEQFERRLKDTCSKCGFSPCRCAEIAAREAEYKRMEARWAKEEESRKKAALAKRLGGLRALEDFTAEKYTNKEILKALSGYPYGNYFLWGNAGIGKTHAAVAVLRNVPNAYVFRLSEAGDLELRWKCRMNGSRSAFFLPAICFWTTLGAKK